MYVLINIKNRSTFIYLKRKKDSNPNPVSSRTSKIDDNDESTRHMCNAGEEEELKRKKDWKYLAYSEQENRINQYH